VQMMRLTQHVDLTSDRGSSSNGVAPPLPEALFVSKRPHFLPQDAPESVPAPSQSSYGAQQGQLFTGNAIPVVSCQTGAVAVAPAMAATPGVALYGNSALPNGLVAPATFQHQPATYMTQGGLAPPSSAAAFQQFAAADGLAHGHATGFETATGSNKDGKKPKQTTEGEMEVCRIGGCTKAYGNKAALTNHRTRSIKAVDRVSIVAQTDSHIIDGWRFWVDPISDTKYCARGKDAEPKAAGQGCRRPHGHGIGFCNAAKQIGGCKPCPTCRCGESTFADRSEKRGRAMCHCDTSAFPQG
jgi:hypothetical protein